MALRFGENGAGEKAIMSRPFGVALLIAGLDQTGAHLFFTDPSGTFMEYSAKAIGSAAEVAQSQLQEEYKNEMSIEEAKSLALKVLKQVMEEKINKTNAQIAVVSESTGFKVFSEEELFQLLENI